MPVPSAITDLSATAASNSPSGSEAPTEGDNHLRTAYAFIKQLYDGVSGVAYPTLAQLASTASASDGDALIGVLQPYPNAIADTQHRKNSEKRSVFDFMTPAERADVIAGTMSLDMTAAFNRATQSSATWSSALEYDIEVPYGKYLLNGKVYVRKGQSLVGVGRPFINCTGNTTTNSFLLGEGEAGADPGGSPVKISNMWTSGGAGAAGTVKNTAQGFEISSMFMTFPGIGLELSGADGIISDIEIDQCLSGIILSGAQNMTFSNIQIYLPNYGITFNSDCRDLAFNGGVIEYTQYAGVHFGDSQGRIKAVTFSNYAFTMNAQYTTFLGYVYKRSSEVEAQFTGCSFRNWYQYAINDAAGITCNLTFTGCVFDGSRSTTAYSQSTTAKVLNTGGSGANGVYNFMDCEYRNLPAEIATLNDGITRLVFNGGLVQGCDANATSQKRFNVVTSLYQKSITVKGVLGFAYKSNDATNQFIVLPYWCGCTQWRVSVKGNTFLVGSNIYSRAEEGIASVSTAYNGAVIVEYCDYTQLWKTPTRAIPGDLALVAAFGTTPGGATNQAPAVKGTICVSSPTAVANALGFEFFVETLT